MKRSGPTPRHRRIMIGWREWIALPEFEVPLIKAKVDTGARSSALHAWNVETYSDHGKDWVRFDVHPIQRNNRRAVRCAALLSDIREIRNSGGQVERRYVIRTAMQLGRESWPIDISLTNRDEMGFRLLLGRAAIRKRCFVNPGGSFLWGRPADWSAD